MDRSVSQVVCELAIYVSIHPYASDTCKGIRRWWLPDDGTTEDDVATALQWMVENGVIERVHAADGRVRYRRCAPADVLQHLVDVCAHHDDGAL